MDRDEFLDAVQRRAQVDSRAEARTIARATLSVLGQRINESDVEDVASHLPETLADTLISESETTEEFSADTFAERVHRRQIEDEQFSVPPTERHVRAVMDVIGAAVPENTLDEVRNQLSTDFESLFEPASADTHYSEA